MTNYNRYETYLNEVRNSFKNFLYITWKHLNLPDPTPVQYDIADYLQHGPKRREINAFRGVGKSWITSAYVDWRLLRDPAWNTLVVSASKDRSDAFSTFTKRLILEMPILEHLRPQPGEDIRWSNVAFDVAGAPASHAPSVKSVGITGQMTGSRADEIIADDIESLSNSLTQTMRDRISETVKEFDAILKPKDTSSIVYLGTPQLEMSLYNELANRGYDQRIWPARIPENVEKYRGKLAPYVLKLIEDGAQPGDPVDPDRFDNADLDERLASYGRTGFALQFMMDTSLSDLERFPLRLKDLIVWPTDRERAPVTLTWGNEPDRALKVPSPGLTGDKFFLPIFTSKAEAEFTGSSMFIDPSGGGKDETAYVVLKYLHGFLYLVASGGFREGYSEATLKALALVAKEHRVNHVGVEQNFGDGMFEELLKPVLGRVHPVTVEGVRHSSQKERRICDTLEPIMNQHRLVVDQKVVEDDQATEDPRRQLFYQMTRITRERGALVHDDRLDALAGGVSYWVESMARDTLKAEAEHQEELRQKAIDAWVAEFEMDGKSSPEQTTWHDLGGVR